MGAHDPGPAVTQPVIVTTRPGFRNLLLPSDIEQQHLPCFDWRMTRTADRARAMELRREAGASLSKIAKEFGISPSTVGHILLKLERRRAGEQRELRPTSLEALEMAGKVPRQLRSALEAAAITDLAQLQRRRRSEVLLIRGISSKSIAMIAAVMQEAGLSLLDEGIPRR
jgi:transposase-like protein